MKTPFVTEILRRIAPRLGATIMVEPEFGFVGQISFKNGRKAFFRDRNFNINRLGSVEIAKDKGYSEFFLRTFGYRVPEGRTFFSPQMCENIRIKRNIDDGYLYARGLGFPVVLKPNSLSQGVLVAKVYDKREYYRVARQILKRTSVMLVQRYCAGRDYRLVVLDDEVISAYERIPLTIRGDGKNTVAELLEQKQQEFVASGRDTIIDTEDFRLRDNLRRQKLTFESVLDRDRSVRLLDNANLSTGGDANDVTGSIHSDYRRLAVEITRKMELRLCGVDLITSDIAGPLGDYIVIEINGSPGLDNYAAMGATQQDIVDSLYLKVLRALESEL